ncbi:MAG: HD domain-containing protein [Bacteroidales bacterium]|nr:HD domain-containing protein [Bacteroidales bacterium]
MMEFADKIKERIDTPIFRQLSEVAEEVGVPCYVVGGYVRDIILDRPSKDIDVVVVGSGIVVAERYAKKLGKGAHLSVFRNFGTAQVKYRGMEVEFVGARKESYSHDSRKPVVENGTLEDDQNRRDFTINDIAASLNKANFGDVLDPFGGFEDIKTKTIRTPLDPDITFSDDPLRMMRAIRFATQLQFDIAPETFRAIARNCKRISIISGERIIDEINKIMKSQQPSIGFKLLDESGLLELIMPELSALKGVDNVEGKGHKDNFYHTLTVLDNVALRSDNLWLRWAALMHDIGKPVVKRYDKKTGWTFHNHNYMGAKMIQRIFRNLKLPLGEEMKYVRKLVDLHMRPIVLAEDIVTDSAIRRLLFDAGVDIEDLMLLCEADITSRNREKVARFKENFGVVRQKLKEIEEKDRIREFQPPVSGEEIMALFGLPPSRPVGDIKEAIKEAILDGIIPNEYEPAYNYMLKVAADMGLKPVNNG